MVWVFFLFLGLATHVLAENDISAHKPGHYAPVNPKKLQKDLDHLSHTKMTQQDLNAFSARVHDVSMIGSSEVAAPVIPASNRPRGDLKLNSVYIVPSGNN